MPIPTILWGEHRTEELLALDVKEALENDQDLSGKLQFIECPIWEATDYILRLRRTMSGEATSENLFRGKSIADCYHETSDYWGSLFSQYGPYCFNFHDTKLNEDDLNIAFMFEVKPTKSDTPTKTAKKMKRLVDLLANESSLNVKSLITNTEGPTIVEFYVPPRLSMFPSSDVESLVRQRFPNTWQVMDTYMVPDRGNPEYAPMLANYVAFMKKFFLALGQGLSIDDNF